MPVERLDMLEELYNNLKQNQQVNEERLHKQEERLNQHGQRLERHDEKLASDKKDIDILLKHDKEHELRLMEVEKNYMKLEDTVSKENKETRDLMRSQTDKLYNIVEQAMGYQEAQQAKTHELRMAKLNMWSTVFLKVSGGIVALLSSGGAIYYMITRLMETQ